MRLLKLRLLAFGPFTNVEIDLAAPGVQVIFGRNEAGKSTTLRAIAGLLYGISKSTPDAHLHKMPDLRIGGVVADENGRVLDLVRRKGRDNTLLDRQGQPVDEAVLTRLLGGVGEEQFLTMFGLDHASLREGGAALLLAEGNVGESLFGAAMAGGELHKVLRSLRDDADKLFKPKAPTTPLNEAIRNWSDANKRTRVESMSHEVVDDQVKGLGELRQERAACEGERHRLQIEQKRLERACRALPILTARQTIADKRRGMGSVVLLPSDTQSIRIEQQRIASDTAHEIARLEDQIRDLSERRSRLVIPESLVRLEELPFDITNRLGSQRKAAADRPRIEAEIDELETQAREILRKIGRDVPLSGGESWRVDAASHATIRTLALDRTALAEAQHKTRRATVEKTARREALVERRARLAPAPDTTALKKALQRAEREGPLDERLTKVQSRTGRLEKDLAAQLTLLGLDETTDPAILRVPSSETVDRFARQWAQLERDSEHLSGQQSTVGQRLVALTRDIEAIEQGGKVPTEQDLSSARRRRDDRWQLLRGALEKTALASRRKAIDSESLSQFEIEVQAADAISDGLRHEAERVSRLADHLAERQTRTREQQALAKNATDLDARRATAEEAWRSIWSVLGIEPQPPSEMKGWLVQHAAAVRAAAELREAQAEIAALRGSIASHEQPLRVQIDALGSPAPSDSTLTGLLDRASELVQAIDAIASEHRRLDHDIHELETDLAALSATHLDEERQAAQLMGAWQIALVPLGLAETVSPAEATATIEHLAEASHKIDQASATRRRASSIERDARAFATDVRTLADEHAPDVASLAAEKAAAAIIERFQQGKTDVAERRQLERQHDEATRRLATQRDRHALASAMLADLLMKADVTSAIDLELAETRSHDAARLDQDLARFDAQLLELGGDASSLQIEFEQWDTDTAAARVSELEAELDLLHQRTIVVGGRILSYEAGLKKLDAPEDKAAQAALEAEGALARVRDLAERYLTVRIASVVLGREIERYRKENQGPILARASELFGRLTLGSFTSLKVDFDEKDTPVLLGVKSDGRELLAPAMSDGTRDQLFLALRIATLERYAEHNDPLPLVVDDILVHFDDERAQAALEVLADLSRRTQVLFFTHHARLVELAKRTIDASRLSVRELGETPTNPAAAQLAKPSTSAMVAPK